MLQWFIGWIPVPFRQNSNGSDSVSNAKNEKFLSIQYVALLQNWIYSPNEVNSSYPKNFLQFSGASIMFKLIYIIDWFIYLIDL